MNQQPKQQIKREERVESILTVLLLFFIIFAILLPIFALVGGEGGKTDPTATTTDPAPSPKPLPPVVANAVFSGGTLPKMPVVNANTATLSSELYSKCGVIVDVENGVILAGKGADDPIAPASMTKVMTLIVACEKLTEDELDKRLTFTQYYYDYEYNGLDTTFAKVKYDNGSTTIDDRILIRDLLYGIGVESAADCTMMIAEYTYGSLASFVDAMNAKATALGLGKTLFVDPYGDDKANDLGQTNVTTAKEMAVIMMYAMQCDLIQNILSTGTYKCNLAYTKGNGTEDFYGFSLYSHLFENGNVDGNNKEKIDSRMEYFRTQINSGQKFELKTAKDYVGKTGYLTPPSSSYLVFSATGKETGNQYVAVVAELTGTSIFARTMKDIQTLFDGYAK